MTVIKNNPIEILSSDDSDDENSHVEGSYESEESVGEEEDDDYNNYQMPEFRNDRVYGWELLITKAYASSKKEQVLHMPANCFRRVLRGRDSIVMKAQHSGDIIKCTLITYERDGGYEEMYISTGWFEFMNANDIRKGDRLQFQLSNPPNVLFVNIIRANV
ncbi:hypothetical protein P8452_04093 [Trifolium repens]|nr:hypothetical protein P8452_04093 [Trifolium repens]